MTRVVFITLDEALKLHEKSLNMFSGSPGVRDITLLESALSQPKLVLFGEQVYKDIFEMSAAYCFHVIKNHPFVDGNKRAGLLIALVFLRNNNIHIRANHDELYALVMKIADSQIEKKVIANFFRKTAVFLKKT